MNEFEIGKSVLLKLVVDEMPFALVLRKTFKKIDVDPVTKSNITALVGCELRHHYIFDSLINRFISESIEFEKTVYLRFYLANHLFLRRFKDAELLALAKNDMPMTEVDDLIKFIDSTNEYIPEELDKASPEFLSLRYNTPALPQFVLTKKKLISTNSSLNTQITRKLQLMEWWSIKAEETRRT